MINNRDIVLFIASDDGHTVEEAANNFGVSISTIKKRLAQVRDENNPNYDKSLADRLKLAQTKVIIRGNKKGGEIGKRSSKYNEKVAIMLAETYMSGLTIRELSKLIAIPSSTLWEIIRSVKDPEVQLKIDRYILAHESIIPEKPYEDETLWKR